MLRKLKRRVVRRFLSSIPTPLARRVCAGRPRAARLLPTGIEFELADFLGEFRVFLDTTFTVEREMVSGLYDRRTLELIRRQVKAGDTCLDVGANVGALTLALAQSAGHNGKVLAFEPGTPNFRRLQRNIAANADLDARVECHQLGLGNEAGTLCWEEEAENRGNAMLRTTGGSEQVAVARLDDFLAERPDIDGIDFIKIDVEGMELDVLRGAERTLQQWHPKIYFESQKIWRQKLGSEHFLNLERFLLECGYQLQRLNRNGGLQPTTILQTSSNTLALPI